MPNAGDEINCMSCHQIEPHIVDMARGLTSDQDAQLARHILGCPSCAGLLEQERAMSAALSVTLRKRSDCVPTSPTAQLAGPFA